MTFVNKILIWMCVAEVAVYLADAGTVSFPYAPCIVNGANQTNCSNFLNDLESDLEESQTCDTNYWKLELNVSESFPCFSLMYNVTCMKIEELQLSQLEEELCLLTEYIIANGTKAQVRQLNANQGETNTFNHGGNTITLSTNTDTYILGLATAPFFDYRVSMSDNFERATANSFYVSRDSDVVVISMVDRNGTTVDETVRIKFGMKQYPLNYLPESSRVMQSRRICAYLNTTTFQWTDEKCKKISENDNETVCDCEHNSAFAVVFALREINLGGGILTASTVLEVVSIAALLITAIILGLYREKMRSFDRVLVQINLCIALMFTHLFFVVSPLATHAGGVCVAMALVTHFFLTSTAVFMVLEGSLMLTKVLAPNFLNDTTSTKRRRIIGFLVAWILPMIYVAACGVPGILSGNYVPWSNVRERYESCWVHHGFNLTVIIPIGIALLINTGIAIRLGVLVWHMSKSAEEFKPSNLRDVNKASHAAKALRAIVILLPILGIPWIIGFLVNIPPVEKIFGSMHVVVNGLQGLMLFSHYVIFNSEIRVLLQRSWKQAIANVSSLTPTVQFTSRSESETGLKSN